MTRIVIRVDIRQFSDGSAECACQLSGGTVGIIPLSIGMIPVMTCYLPVDVTSLIGVSGRTPSTYEDRFHDTVMLAFAAIVCRIFRHENDSSGCS